MAKCNHRKVCIFLYSLSATVLSFCNHRFGDFVERVAVSKTKKQKNIAGYLFAVFGSALIFSMLFYKSFDGVKLVFTLKTSPKHMLELQEQRKLFDWLNENTQKDAVVYFLGEGVFESNLPIYTDVNLYYGGLPTSFWFPTAK